MTETEKLSLALKLRELGALRDSIFESLIDAETPRALLADVDQLHTQAAELLAAVVGLCRQPGELPFPSANIAIPAERTPEADKASQFAYSRAELPSDADVSGLLSDAEPVFSGLRDQRRSA